VFDYQAFAAELLPIAVRALDTVKSAELELFIDQYRTALVDPDSAQHLDSNWRSMLANRDIDEYADFALTKYYDPSDDIGFGNDWQQVSEALERSGLPPELGLGSALERGGSHAVQTHVVAPGQAQRAFHVDADRSQLALGDVGPVAEQNLSVTRGKHAPLKLTDVAGA
jgi:hypothetical protein